MQFTTIAIDIAKSSFHVVRLSKNKVSLTKAFTRQQLKIWLSKQKSSLVVIEACGSAHYWARYSRECGHTARLIAPKHVTPFRQGHKTDKNDALAIAIASQQPQVKKVAIKTIEQQQMQSVERMRQHLTDNQTAVSNMIRGLLAEFGICIARGIGAFKNRIPEILEDAENQLPHVLRHQIAHMYDAFIQAEKHLEQVNQQLKILIQEQPQCKRLMALEGVGPINALNIFLILGNKGESFAHGREAAACIGLTPKQYSTGGTVIMGGIAKKAANKRLRANLIQGALSAVNVAAKRHPKNSKEQWLQNLIVRAGKRRAAVALANKTIRTAWAMLRNNQDYSVQAAV